MNNGTTAINWGICASHLDYLQGSKEKPDKSPLSDEKTALWFGYNESPIKKTINQFSQDDNLLEISLEKMVEHYLAIDKKYVENLESQTPLYKEAWMLFVNGEVAKALAVLDDAKLDANEKKTASERMLKAEILASQLRFEEAEKHFQRGVEIYPDHNNCFQFAYYLQQQKQYTKALPMYEKALKIRQELAKTNPQVYNLEFCRTKLLICILYYELPENKRNALLINKALKMLEEIKVTLKEYAGIPLAQTLLSYADALISEFTNMK